MGIAVFIMQCLIVLLIFGAYDRLIKPNDQPHLDNVPTKEMEIFRHGAKQNWLTINVCLYKMWNELEILDYDNISTKLQQTLEELTNSPEKLEEWAKKFNEYIQEQKK